VFSRVAFVSRALDENYVSVNEKGWALRGLEEALA
jgi:hypothetical protein